MIDDVPLSYKQIILSSLKKRRERGGVEEKGKRRKKTSNAPPSIFFPFCFFPRLATPSIALVLHVVQSLNPKQENRFFKTELFTAQLRAEF